MTTQAATDTRATGVGTDDLFHIPFDDANEALAQRGLPWRTLCGQTRPPAREHHDWFDELPDDCAMCVHLEATEADQ